MIESFSYVANKSAKILILGSMPGVASLEANEYYAHPRNLFWDFMEEFFFIERALPYQKRLGLLKKNNIALWDVAHQCEREGSLDTKIRNVKSNDFEYFFYSVLFEHPKILA